MPPNPIYRPSIDDAAFNCPKTCCGRQLHLKYAKKGSHARRWFITCDIPEHDSQTKQPPQIKCKHTRSTGKARDIDVPDSSDNDIVIIDYIPAIKQEKMTPPPKRPRLFVNIPSSPSLPALSSTSTSAGPSTTPPLSPSFPFAVFPSPPLKDRWCF
ncbi:hypothetical protein DFH07DRAFT_502477 [Mycena maculata]|uniref:Uncharacterized protein n=1 Tax=Mycena maculata TaxID=230809 RepID=A0AAD7J4B7_9AGAR|nr:hypothetical protein DFH07DRAFT_502477 [Mycena maculata]